MARPFLKHQLAPAVWAEDRPLAPIFMDMRLGKCKVVIHRAKQRAAKKILIVSPIEAMAGWQRELTAEGENFAVAYGTKEKRLQAILDANAKFGGERFFVITNARGLYEPAGRRPCPECKGNGSSGAKAIVGMEPGDEFDEIVCWKCFGKGTVKGKKATPTELATLPYDAVVWDESTLLKNAQSQVSKIAVEHLGKIPDRAILSGEFAPESAMDIFMQMRFCLGSFMGHTNFWDWRDEFFQQYGFDWMPKAGTIKRIHEELEKYAYRLTSQEAGTYVKPLREKISIDLPPRLRRMVDQAIRDMEIMDDETGKIISTSQTMVVGGWIAQLAGGYPKFAPSVRSNHKMKVFVDRVVALKGEQFVATFRFNNELEEADQQLKLATAFARLKGRFVKVTGETKPAERKKLEEEFREKKISGLLMQVKVARFGIDLSSADWMLRYSLPYSWEEVSQPMMRVVHPTKKRPVTYVDFVVKDTTDEDVYAASLTKKDGARGFMRSDRQDAEDFNDVLKGRITQRVQQGQRHGEMPKMRRSLDQQTRRTSRGSQRSAGV